MPELGQPWWLLALGLIPLVRRLHRRGLGTPAVWVPAAFLWRDLGLASDAGRRQTPPDPAWRRRAVLVALIALALAEPRWSTPTPRHLEVWLDDGPSLFAREADGTTRLHWAASAVADALGDVDPAQIELRALHRPGEARRLAPGLDAHALSAELEHWLTAPGPARPPTLVPPPRPGTDRWLVSDGADPSAAAGLDPQTLARTIAVGAAGDNQAVTRLALRPSLTAPGRDLVLVGIVNAGPDPAQRTLTLTLTKAGDRETLGAWPLTLAPGESRALSLPVPNTLGAETGLTATLDPTGADALALDDTLTLPARPGPLPVTLGPDCPRPVRLALAAHPGLDLAPTGAEPPRLRVWCSGARPPATPGLATLWLPPGAGVEAVTGVPVWDLGRPDGRAVEPPALAEEGLRLLPQGPSQVGPDRRVLLSAGGVPLILESDPDQGPRIEVRIATSDPGFGARPEFPALLAALADRLTGTDLLDPTPGLGRDPALARIAPGPLPQAQARPGTVAPLSEPKTPAPWLLALALSILGWDLWRLRRPASAR